LSDEKGNEVPDSIKSANFWTSWEYNSIHGGLGFKKLFNG